jgi:hypothetical protein
VETSKPRIRKLPPGERAREWPGVARFGMAGGWDAGGETARETGNLATWGCESGGGQRAVQFPSGSAPGHPSPGPALDASRSQLKYGLASGRRVRRLFRLNFSQGLGDWRGAPTASTSLKANIETTRRK